MKKIKWLFLSSEVNYGTEEAPDIRQHFISKDFPYSNETLEAAKREAFNGEYEIYDDGLEEIVAEPTETEILDARLTYVEMMMGLLEV